MSSNDVIKWADVDSATRRALSNSLWYDVYRPAVKGWRCQGVEEELLGALAALCREIDDKEKEREHAGE